MEFMKAEAPGQLPSVGTGQVISELRAQLREAHETLDAIRYGEVDAVLVRQAGSNKIFTLVNADRPYRFLIEQMKEGAVTLSEEGVVLYGNRRLAEILDAPIEKIVGSSIKRFFMPDELPRLETLIAGAALGATRGEFHLQRAGQAAVPIYLSVSDIVSEPGAPRLIGGVVTDMTDQHAIDARLRQAGKMQAVGRLTGGLAHDFNNLLQTICGNLKRITDLPLDSGHVGEWAQAALTAADRGARLTAQLMTFSRTQDVEIVPVDVEALVMGMAELLERTLGPGIDVSYALGASGAWVMADKVQIELAIVNMCMNARDAMPTGGQLRVTTRLCDVGQDADLEGGSYLELGVADTGAGMEESVRARAFDPFFTTKGPSQASGLGLAQVYGIARQAGGTARIVSHVGFGTQVTLLLRPIQAPLVAATSAAAPLAAEPDSPRAKVLVVDDDNAIRLLLTEGLTALGYTVSAAASGVEGLDAMRADPPDVLVSDFMMPFMNGAQMVTQARAWGFLMPVIFASGYARTQAMDDAVGAKAVLLAKPFTIIELAAAIERALVTADLCPSH